MYISVSINVQYISSSAVSINVYIVGSVVEWLERRAYDQHDLGSKPTCATLLCPWEIHFMALPLVGGLGKQF